MQIVIPTFGRVHKQTTLSNLPPNLRKETLLVTSDSAEFEALSKAWRGQIKGVKNAPVSSIVAKRQWILENIKSDVFMMDDDMDFYKRCPLKNREFVGGRWRPKDGWFSLSKTYVTEHDLISLFDELREYLESGTSAVGISSRFGNDLEYSAYKLGANRIMHALGYRRAVLRKMKFAFDAVAFREDFHMALTLYRAGHSSYQVYDWCVAPGAYGAPGGCSSERTTDASDAAAEELAKLHAPFVKVVQKEYKGTPRKEVVVQWKKALESAT